MKDHLVLAMQDTSSDVKINQLVSIRATKSKLMLKYSGSIIGEYDVRSALLKDFSYSYHRARGYDSNVAYWMDRFRESLYEFIK